MTWKRESQRHSLASRGMKTIYKRKEIHNYGEDVIVPLNMIPLLNNKKRYYIGYYSDGDNTAIQTSELDDLSSAKSKASISEDSWSEIHKQDIKFWVWDSYARQWYHDFGDLL